MQRKNEFEKKIYKKLHVIVLFTWYIYNELGASIQKINASYWKKCDWFLITYMYNEWNFLHSYKIKSYKSISLDKKKMGIYKNYLSVTLHHIKSKIVYVIGTFYLYQDIGDSL